MKNLLSTYRVNLLPVKKSRSQNGTCFTRYHFRAQKVSISGPTPSNGPRNGYCPHQNPNVPRHINNRYIITIYAPVIYTRPCIMFWRRGYTLRGEVGGGWALEFPSFLGPVTWHRADMRVPFRAQKTRELQGPTPSNFPKVCISTPPKHYAQGCINHRCIGCFMHTREV